LLFKYIQKRRGVVSLGFSIDSTHLSVKKLLDSKF